jgi:hypothetical protein
MKKPIISNVPNTVKRLKMLQEYSATAHDLRHEFIEHLAFQRINCDEFDLRIAEIEKEISELSVSIQAILN